MRKKVKVESKQFKQDLRNLALIGNNLNQLALNANKYHWLSDYDKKILAGIISELYNTLKAGL